MKKLILVIALILGFHSAQAQCKLDTSDLFEGLRYSVSVPYYDKYDGRSFLIEREKIDCYFYGKSRERFIQITRFDGEIVSVLDDAPELGVK